MVIYTNEGILDIYEGIKYPFNYAIGDVRDITKRNIDYSKTIKLPATKNNNKFFEYFYNVSVQSGNFDVNQKEFIRVEQDGNVVFEGFLQLLSVSVNDGFKYYEAVVFSSFRNILDIVQGLDLNDLDFSEYNHPYALATFKNSIAQARKNYKYFDNGGVEQSINLGFGYTYPYISYNGNVEDYEDNLGVYPNAFPSFFIREYIDKIFLLAGYKVESKFFDTEYFKSLILPFSNGDLILTEEDSEIYSTSYSGVNQTDFINGSVVSVYSQLLTDLENYDYSNQFDNTTYILTPTKGGLKNIKIKGEASIEYIIPAGKSILKNQSQSTEPFLRFTQFNLTAQTFNNNSPYLEQISQQPANVFDLVNRTYTFIFESTIAGADSAVDDKLNYLSDFKNSTYYYIENGLRVYLDANLIFNDFSFEYDLVEGSEIKEGDILNMTRALPKFKITDFLKSIISMFNLYIYPKKESLNTLIIETRDEFYSNNKTHFLDDKLDVSKGYKISTLSEESAKTYLYKYKEGKDYINKEYDAANDGKKYAQKEVITDNQFLTNTQSYTTSFAATGNRYINNKNVAVVFDREEEASDFIPKKIKTEPRILFYNGLGFASQRNSLEFSTFTLDFEAMKYTTVVDEWLPYFDLYNLFHKNTIEEVSGSNAKLLTCYLNIDMSEISIEDKVYILGEYWRINKIVDYDANSNDTTRVELFKLKGNVNYLTAEAIIEQAENNNSKFNNQFNNNFS